MNYTGVCEQPILLREPWLCSPAAETAFHPMIWCSESLSSQGLSSAEECFSTMAIYLIAAMAIYLMLQFSTMAIYLNSQTPVWLLTGHSNYFQVFHLILQYIYIYICIHIISMSMFSFVSISIYFIDCVKHIGCLPLVGAAATKPWIFHTRG